MKPKKVSRTSRPAASERPKRAAARKTRTTASARTTSSARAKAKETSTPPAPVASATAASTAVPRSALTKTNAAKSVASKPATRDVAKPKATRKKTVARKASPKRAGRKSQLSEAEPAPAKPARVTQAESQKTAVAPTEPRPEKSIPSVQRVEPVRSAEPTRTSTKPVRPARKALRIPPILLEGDQPSPVAISGPGKRYALGPTAPLEHLESEGELPEAYGTQRVLLSARDPHWLYVHWDLTREQQLRYNALSVHRHLTVRIHIDSAGTTPITEVHVHPESRHWFVHVENAATKYVAQLGYYQANGEWVAVSTSGATLTPPDTISADLSAEFATIPFELPLATLVDLVKEAVQEYRPLAEALQELREEGHPALPAQLPPPAQWTPAQERALADVISMDPVRRVWMGSMEITELIRRQFAQEISSMAAAQLALPGSPMGVPPGISSPSGVEAKPGKGFWFNVNAELIVYGATEPGASVTIGGRPIRLRPDGSFSYRFALPDGQYELPIVAVAADQSDGRAAAMAFSRGTEYHGVVGAHPQDKHLKAPLAQNVS